MFTSKDVLKSKTIIANIVSVVIVMFGASMDVGQVTEIIINVLLVFTSGFAMYGRYTAKHTLTNTYIDAKLKRK